MHVSPQAQQVFHEADIETFSRPMTQSHSAQKKNPLQTVHDVHEPSEVEEYGVVTINDSEGRH